MHRKSGRNRLESSVAFFVFSFMLLLGITAQAQPSRNVAINGTQVFPESITSTSDGTIFIGSSENGAVYRAAPNTRRAEVWIEPGTSGMKRAIGLLADEKSGILWACAPNDTVIRAFDLMTGAFKRNYGGGCNDLTVAKDGTVYASASGKVLRLRPGGSEFEQWTSNPQLASADGIAALEDGAVYVNTTNTGFIFRIPVTPSGAAGALRKLRTIRPLVRPGGMTPVGPKSLLMVEAEGRLVEITISGDEAQLQLVRDGLANVPAAVTLVGNIAYVLESKTNLRGQDPGAFLAAAVPYSPQETELNSRPANAPEQKPAFAGQTRAPEDKTNVAYDVVTVAQGLQLPWGLTFLPDGRMLVTERPGRLRVVSKNGELSEPVAGLPAVDSRGQGGLLDIALDPNYASNQLIYWSYAEPREGEVNNTAVARGKFVDGPTPRVENVQVIFRQAPSMKSLLHFGCRLVFARDGKLFITLGERSIIEGRMQAQRLDGLLGKVVRINPDGSIPKDNPFVGKTGARPEIWSSGHRNIQSAALNPVTGELWEVEHGTRGGDELNIARKGKDYGWPTIAYGIEYRGQPITEGLTAKEGLEQPIYYWDPVIAPSGMAFYTGNLFPAWKGSLFIGGLGTTNLVRLTLKGDKIVGEERLLRNLQPKRERIRDVRQGPDGAIYVLTDNIAGRILKLVPSKR